MDQNISRKIYIYWKFHPVTSTLLLINFMLVLVLIFNGGFSSINLVAFGAIYPPFVLEDNQWYRLVTAMFLHGNIIHFLMNSLFLFYLGSHLERLIGQLRYGFLYAVAGIISSIFVVYFGPYNAITIGSSGSLFGIVGALLLLTFLKRSWFAPQEIKSIRQLVIINLILTFAIREISTPGHLGGLLTGLTLFYFLIPEEPDLPNKIKKFQKELQEKHHNINENDDDFI